MSLKQRYGGMEFPSTPPRINIEPENDGLVQMIFHFQGCILRFQPLFRVPTSTFLQHLRVPKVVHLLRHLSLSRRDVSSGRLEDSEGL